MMMMMMMMVDVCLYVFLVSYRTLYILDYDVYYCFSVFASTFPV